MAFKLKKRIHEILQMDFDAYAKFLKKESQRATTFGELDVVVCTEHRFADNKVGTLVLMGAFVGDLANYYKDNKTQPTFAKGQGRFEEQAKTTVWHFSLTTGRAKADKVVKAGRKLWAKTGLTPQIHKGKLALSSETTHSTVAPSPQSPPTSNVDWQVLQQQYLHAKKDVQRNVLPSFKAQETLMPKHLTLIKRALKAAQVWQQQYQQASEAEQAPLKSIQEQLAREYQQLQHIAQQVQQRLA